MELTTYNFNSSSDEIASDRNSLILAKSGNASNGLTLDTGIPLWFEDIDVIGCCEIESEQSQYELTLFTIDRRVSLTRMLPRCAHKQNWDTIVRHKFVHIILTLGQNLITIDSLVQDSFAPEMNRDEIQTPRPT